MDTTIHGIAQLLILIALICWIVIYPMDSTVHPLNNWGPFLKSPKTLRAIFGCHYSLCNSRMESIYFVKLHSYFSFCYLENMLKDLLSKRSGWQFHRWLFGAEKFSGLSRNGSLGPVQKIFLCRSLLDNIHGDSFLSVFSLIMKLSHNMIRLCLWIVK